MKTAEAASIMRDAFKALFGREPNRRELEFALAQSHGESSWGEGWKGDCRGSNNWGALQTYPGNAGPICNAVDSNADGKYDAGFQVYSSPLEGAKGYLKEAYKRRPGVLAAVNAGDVNGAVSELYRTGYFTGNACLEKGPNGCVVIDHATNKARYRALIVDRITGARPGLPSISRELTEAGYTGGTSARGSSVSGSGGVGVVLLLGVAGAVGYAVLRR